MVGDLTVKKALLVVMCVLFLFVVGCGTSSDDEQVASNLPTDSVTEEVTEEKVQDENQAMQILMDELEISPESDSKVYLLREAMLGDELIYAYERVGLKGGASHVYFVDSKGNVYNNSTDLLVDFFKKSSNKEQYADGKYLGIDMYYVEMKSINDPEVITWDAHIVNGVGYSDVDSALRAVAETYVEKDPLLSLLGKDVAYVEKATGQKAEDVTIYDVDEIEDMVGKEINYNGAKISFITGNTATSIFYPEGQELLGVKIGDTFGEIIDVLGIPLTTGPDPYFDDIWTMTYEFFGVIHVEFYALDQHGNTVSAIVKAN